MQTVALRFADNFAPPEGTIAAHAAIISQKGFVWYGKMGNPLSADTIRMVLKNTPAKVLLIHSGTQKDIGLMSMLLQKIIQATTYTPIITWIKAIK